MNKSKNLGFDPQEINQLLKECLEAERSFVYFDDLELDEPRGDEYAHFHFVGQDEGQEVIYDAILYTLRMHHSSLVYEEAERRATKAFPFYVPVEKRDETFQPNEELDEEVELLIMEIMEELEENDEIKVLEHVEIDPNTDYGVCLDVCLNVEMITDKIVEKFVRDFNQNILQLDPTLYSFKSESDDDE
jgi:hypothetical protein